MISCFPVLMSSSNIMTAVGILQGRGAVLFNKAGNIGASLFSCPDFERGGM